MMTTPPWWKNVKPEINLLMEGFTDKLRKKLRIPASKIVERKNPFLFRVRSGDDLGELTRMVVDAYLSSSEETMFGHILARHLRMG